MAGPSARTVAPGCGQINRLQRAQLDLENEIHLKPDVLPLWDLVDFSVWQQYIPDKDEQEMPFPV